ncbi:MAG: DNA polymerase III subunit delta' C-terminal domain-containing protein [Oscillospiraceae bacterium]|jgi:DNA polymerase-3 subunit delta'|nr:DNA polymerase III subunit delta' C-terminal domain-containing protein [Oscillospiraceae bacterium]
MKFEGFAGNEKVKQTLSAFVDGGRLPHVLLIEGPEGSGRRTLARLIAKAGLCKSKEEKPCGECSSCIKAKGGNHPDILEIKDDFTSQYKIQPMRDLRQSAYIMPNESERRFIIMPDIQHMSETVQNVLLKILEEPPGYLLFILTCENRTQLLPTILSRTVCVALSSVDIPLATDVIKSALPDTPHQDACNAAAVFGGIIGQAIKGISDGSFRQVLELSPELALAVIAPDELTLLRLTARMEKDKDLVDGVLNLLALIFRDALVRRAGVEDDMSPSPETAQTLARALKPKNLIELISTVDELRSLRQQHINHTLFLTLLCSRFRTAAGR